MSEHYIAIRPRDDQPTAPGHRLRVERQGDDDFVHLVSEVTMPERVALANARRKDVRDRIIAAPDEVRWLHARLGEIVAEMDRDDATAQSNPKPEPKKGRRS